MQLIEVSDLGVRSAVIWLRRRDTPLRFVLFPMLHLGAPTFYQEVTRRLRTCDLVVAEGIHGRSNTAAALNLTFRLFGNANRDGLVEQHIDYAALGVPVIVADMSAREFEAGWREIPPTLRLPARALAPAFSLGMLLFGSRELVARYAEIDDLPSREDVQMAADRRFAPFLKLVIDDRDAYLLRALDRIHGERSSEAIQVAIVYGAEHICGQSCTTWDGGTATGHVTPSGSPCSSGDASRRQRPQRAVCAPCADATCRRGRRRGRVARNVVTSRISSTVP